MRDTNFSSSQQAAVSIALATLGVLCLLLSARDYTPNVQLSSVVGTVTNHVTRSAQGPAPQTPMGRRPIPLGSVTQMQAKGVPVVPPSQPQVAGEASALSDITTQGAEMHPNVHAHATVTASTSDSTLASVMLGVAAVGSIVGMYLWQRTATSGQYTELQGTTIPSGSPSLQGHPPRSYRIAMAAVEGAPELAKTALIVSNKGGGHGEIGFHLVKALRKKGLKVHLVNDTAGKSVEDFTKKPPFSQYHQFDEDAGVEVTYVDLSQSDALDEISGPFGYVFDNENMCQEAVAEKAAGWGSFYTYVSSGGMYLPGDQFPMPESNPTKSADKNGQKKHEEFVMSDSIRPRLAGCAFFRPQYIVGPHTNKRDYLDWFFNRLVRKLPVPIPGDGAQTTTVTDARDVSNMLAAVVGKEAEILAAEKEDPALGPIFNCASSTSASLNAITMACGKACDLMDEEITELITYYNPKDFPDLPKGAKFPFRATNFDVGVEKAKSVLGWECEYSTDIEKVAKQYFEGYQELGLTTKVKPDQGSSVPFATSSARTNRKDAKPINPSGWPNKFPAKELCSRCGLCETTFVSEVKTACAFLGPGMARIDDMERVVHGRQRHSELEINPNLADEARFGVLHEPIRLAKGNQIHDAQWTGVVTGIALAMLESGEVDAVVCISNGGDGNFASPEPILARTTEEVLKGRGVKPALAPSLRVLDEIEQDPSIQRLLFCGVGCAVQAFRAVQSKLGLEKVYVLGTNCADNSPTPQAAKNFIQNGVQIDDTEEVQGYEFMQDFQVHVKSKNSYTKKPYFSLPGTIAEDSIAKSCRACFDYTNGLADVVVGYMGAPLDSRMDQSFQTLSIRNERGVKMVEIAQSMSRLTVGDIAPGTGSHEKLTSVTVASDAIVAAMVGSPVPEQGMPEWLGQVFAYGMRTLGPKGINFARYSIDYHVLRNFLFLLKKKGDHQATMMAMPQNARDTVKYYQENDKQFADLVSKIQKTEK